MIQIPDSKVSQHYAKQAIQSWESHGFQVNLFDAVTPKTLHLYDDIQLDQYHGKRDFTDTEMGCWYSHYLLWEKCVEERKPITVIEHETERHTRYVDDIMFDKLNKDLNLIADYCRPIYDMKVGGTVDH